MLIRYCNMDYEREIAIVAEVRENEKRKLIGIGRLIIDREFKSGEFAVLVHDDLSWQGAWLQTCGRAYRDSEKRRDWTTFTARY